MTNINSYSQKVLEHFHNPHNYGKISRPDAVGEVGNVVCGDVMKLYLKIGKNKKGEEIIKDIKFETYGCAAAIATSSVVTDLVKGKTLKQAEKIDKDDVIKSLHGLPPIKIHCSLLAVDALKEALHDYYLNTKKPIPADLKKTHEKNQKDKQIIEERYSSWISAERGPTFHLQLQQLAVQVDN